MGNTEKAEQTPENAQKGHRTKIRKKYDIQAICQSFDLTEQKIFYASKKLPKGWQRDEVFAILQKRSNLANEILYEVKNKKVSRADLANMYHALITAVGKNSHQECLFIRYARSYFKK